MGDVNSILGGMTSEAPEAGQRSLVETVMQEFADLQNYRRPWEPLWQEVRDLIRPDASDFNRTMPIWQDRKRKIYDDLPNLASAKCAAGIQSYVTNPSSRWFEYSTRNMDNDMDDATASYLEVASNRAYDVFCDPIANFNSSCHEFIRDAVDFGTGVLHIDKSSPVQIRTRCIPLSECYISENEYYEVNKLFRLFKYSNEQIAARWPDTCPPTVLKAKDKQERVDIIHAVRPVKNSILPWQSVYVHKESSTILDTGALSYFPYLVWRWSKYSGSVYGRGPGTDCLHTVRMLYSYIKLRLQADQLAVAPPLLLDDQSTIGNIPVEPFAKWYMQPMATRPQMLDYKPNLQVSDNSIETMRRQIGDAFYNDLFTSDDYGKRERVTAVEVEGDRDERLRQLSSVVGRMEHEFLNPLVQTVFTMLEEAGVMPQKPPALRKKNLIIDYLSPAARALRSESTQNGLKFLQTLSPFLQFKPDILNFIDFDAWGRRAAYSYGVSRTCILSADKVAAMNAQKQQAAAAQQQTQQLATVSQGVKNLAQAKQAAPELAGYTGQ